MRWLQLSVQSGIERNNVNDVRVLARLTKLFESTNKFPNAIRLCYVTNQNLNETIALIIKEDEKDKSLIKLNTDTTKVSFKEKGDIPSIMKIDQPNNNSNNNTYNKNKHNRSPQRDRSYNKSDRSYSRDRSPSRDSYRQNNNNNKNYNENTRRQNDRDERTTYNTRQNSRSRSPSQSHNNNKDDKNENNNNNNRNDNKRQKQDNSNEKQFKNDGKCWQLQRGHCKFGDKCKFSHNI